MKSRPAGSLVPGTISRAVGEYGVVCSSDQIWQVQRYLELLESWNDKISLTAIRDPLEILHRHFCESMYGAVAASVERGRLADVGSGAGFPGLALKIIRPELEVFLVESNVKKATFLAEVTRALGLERVRVLVARYEELHEEIAPLDYACSRAMGEFEKFLAWASSERVAARHVVLWVGGRDLAQIQKNEAWDWREAKPVPNSLQRYILVGERKS